MIEYINVDLYSPVSISLADCKVDFISWLRNTAFFIVCAVFAGMSNLGFISTVTLVIFFPGIAEKVLLIIWGSKGLSKDSVSPSFWSDPSVSYIFISHNRICFISGVQQKCHSNSFRPESAVNFFFVLQTKYFRKSSWNTLKANFVASAVLFS